MTLEVLKRVCDGAALAAGWRGGGRTGEDARAYDGYAEGEAPPEPFAVETPEPINRPEAEAELMDKNVLLP